MSNKDQILEILKGARARVDNRQLPLDVRIRSKETVSLCEARIRAEGWAK
ncbi:hypothetical protein [Caulobacter segnis]